MGIFSWIVVGLIAGIIAKFLIGEDIGCIFTIILGIVGGLLGGFLANALGMNGDLTGINLPSILIATIGAIIVLVVGRKITKQSNRLKDAKKAGGRARILQSFYLRTLLI